MPHRLCVIDMPGLSRQLLPHIPPQSALGRWLAGKKISDFVPSFPAVTCSVQATLTTGALPSEHGIIANGLATFRSPEDQALIDTSNFADFRRQVSFWEQSNQLLERPRFWQDESGKSRWKTAMLFFQNSMPGFAQPLRPAADIVLTPKPDHGPDGKLVSLCWSQPADLVPALFKELGPFPLMNYWGPMAGIKSSQWIAAAAQIVWKLHTPQLQWVYIPHLDYDLQRFDPSSPQAINAVIDAAAAVESLVDMILNDGGKIVLLSEYAMTDVKKSVQPNRLLAEAGLLVTREDSLIDYEKSKAFAMVDHQIAHVYVRDNVNIAKELKGIASFAPPPPELRHRRAGDLVLQADPDTWFDYRWWSDAAHAPPFAKLVDIHRKPGYDPLELFWDPATKAIAQDASLIRGSHGLVDSGKGVWIADEPLAAPDTIHAADVAAILSALLG